MPRFPVLRSPSAPLLPTFRNREEDPSLILRRLPSSEPSTRQAPPQASTPQEHPCASAEASRLEPQGVPSPTAGSPEVVRSADSLEAPKPQADGDVLTAFEGSASMTAATSSSRQASATLTTAATNSPSAGPSTVSASAIQLPPSRSPSRGSEVAAATMRNPSRSSLEALMAIQPASPQEAANTARQQGRNVGSGGGGGGGGGGMLPAGYPSLARRMASMPEASIFRSFASLNIRNLLYMQAELVCLEEELNRYQLEDARAGRGEGGRPRNETRQKYANNWLYLCESTSEDASAEHDSAQWRTMELIRERLQKYNEAIIQTMKILSAKEPSEHDLRDIQEYLRSKEMADGAALTGKDQSVWGCVVQNYEREPANDLITLLPRPETDRLTKFFINCVVKRLHNRKRRLQWPRGGCFGIAALDDKTVYRLTFVLTSAAASMLPVASMLALQRVEAVKVKGLSLGLIALFNFVLTVLLTWWAAVKRVEVFAIAAAFSAVNVVFITK